MSHKARRSPLVEHDVIGHPGPCFDIDDSDPAIGVHKQQIGNMTPVPVRAGQQERLRGRYPSP